MGKIYTKRGDKGYTKTLDGSMSKGEEAAEALGAIDELNSWMGAISSKFEVLNSKQVQINKVINIQTNLMKINAILAGSRIQGLGIKNYEVRKLERWIDGMTKELPPLTNFIYPVGEIQVARAVCRRAERAVVRYLNSNFKILNSKQAQILKYLNRLSDYLFTLARWVNFKIGIKDEVWKVN